MRYFVEAIQYVRFWARWHRNLSQPPAIMECKSRREARQTRKPHFWAFQPPWLLSSNSVRKYWPEAMFLIYFELKTSFFDSLHFSVCWKLDFGSFRPFWWLLLMVPIEILVSESREGMGREGANVFETIPKTPVAQRAGGIRWLSSKLH